MYICIYVCIIYVYLGSENGDLVWQAASKTPGKKRTSCTPFVNPFTAGETPRGGCLQLCEKGYLAHRKTPTPL